MIIDRQAHLQALYANPRAPSTPQEHAEFAAGQALLERTANAIRAGADPELAVKRELFDPADSDFVVQGFLSQLWSRLPAALAELAERGQFR